MKNKLVFMLYMVIVTFFVQLLNATWGTAIHEYLHCLSGWVDGGTTECYVGFNHPKYVESSKLLGWSYMGNNTDHYWIRPLMFLCELWLWLKLCDIGIRKILYVRK